MSARQYSVERLDAVLAEIGRLKDSDFPYPHSREALERIDRLFRSHKQKIEELPFDKAAEIVNGFCSAALGDLFCYLPLLGFILRSTNIRNAFEVYGPLLRLAQLIIGPDTKLILSSEWEEYSPFTYREISVLPKFVLIGFPAPESSNPLLLPLAGHELGHTLWRTRQLMQKYRKATEEQMLKEVEKRLKEYQENYPNHAVVKGQVHNNIFVRQAVALPVHWALKQCEEHFCDFVGLYLFEAAYLHAFAYLLSPQMAGQRPVTYPNTLTRVAKLEEAAAAFAARRGKGYVVPGNYCSLFSNMAEIPDKERTKKFLLSLADAVVNVTVGEIINESIVIMEGAGVPIMDEAATNAILKSFKFIVPAIQSKSLSNILNAAWRVYNDKRFWDHIPQLNDKRRALRELVLKNIEVLEIEQILEHHA